jgi:hypothetical protein
MQKFSIKYWQTKFSNMLEKITYPDKVNFIPVMQAWFNICKSLNVILTEVKTEAT